MSENKNDVLDEIDVEEIEEYETMREEEKKQRIKKVHERGEELFLTVMNKVKEHGSLKVNKTFESLEDSSLTYNDLYDFFYVLTFYLNEIDPNETDELFIDRKFIVKYEDTLIEVHSVMTTSDGDKLEVSNINIKNLQEEKIGTLEGYLDYVKELYSRTFG